MGEWFDKVARLVSHWLGRPAAFFIALLMCIVWAILGPFFGWSDTHLLLINTTTTIITYLMVFVLQNSSNRDNLAINAKLDELLKQSEADENKLEQIEEKSEKEIIRMRDSD